MGRWLSAVSVCAVYAGVGEGSVYVADGAHGGGVGRALFGGLVEVSEAAGMWTLQGSILPENQASMASHQRFGFRLMGWREKIAWMSYGPMANQWRDMVIMEQRITTVGRPASPG